MGDLPTLESLLSVMHGPPKERALDRSVLVSLERLVPANHFYRHLEARLDLSFVRPWVSDLYATGGRPSIDPVVFFRFQLVMFFEGIRSERHLVEQARLNLAHLWATAARYLLERRATSRSFLPHQDPAATRGGHLSSLL